MPQPQQHRALSSDPDVVCTVAAVVITYKQVVQSVSSDRRSHGVPSPSKITPGRSGVRRGSCYVVATHPEKVRLFMMNLIV